MILTGTEISPTSYTPTPVRRTIVKSWKTRREGRTVQLRAVRQVEVLPGQYEGAEPGLLISERYYSDQRPISKGEFRRLAGRSVDELFR